MKNEFCISIIVILISIVSMIFTVMYEIKHTAIQDSEGKCELGIDCLGDCKNCQYCHNNHM